jgi:hypothetical protein
MKSFKLLGFVGLMSLIIFSGCGDKEVTGDLNIRFKLKYGDQPLEMFKQYNYPVSDEKLFFQRVSFFISNITLRSSEGDFNLKDIDYLDLTQAHTDPVKANGFEYKLSSVLARNYTSLDFGIGVPKESNALQPKDFKAGHILSSSAEYWSTWKSYIFFRPEGLIALDGQTEPETSFALHLGADEAYRNFSINKSISITEGGVTNLDIEIDMKKFFDGKTLFDIHDTQQIHSLFQLPIIDILADNLEVAIK